MVLKSRISVGDPAGAEASKVPMFCHTVREGGLIRAWALIGEGVCVGIIRGGGLIRAWALIREGVLSEKVVL